MPEETDAEVAAVERPLFHKWLKSHARGTLDGEATAALAELVAQVSDLEKPGKLILELKVDVAGSGGRTVLIAGKVTTKPPEPAPEASVFYVGDGGSLHRDDPYQGRLPIDGPARRIDEETGEVRRLDSTEGE